MFENLYCVLNFEFCEKIDPKYGTNEFWKSYGNPGDGLVDGKWLDWSSWSTIVYCGCKISALWYYNRQSWIFKRLSMWNCFKDPKPFKETLFPISRYKKKIFADLSTEMIDQGILEEAEYSGYVSCCFLVKNKGGSNKIIANYVHLNSVVVGDGFLSPNIEEFVSSLAGYRLISKIDLEKTCNTFQINEESKNLQL